MSETPQSFPGADAWMKFWSDAMGKMSAAAGSAGWPGMSGATAGPSSAQAFSPSEMVARMQQMFLETWAKGLDQYMRSEPFLETMKKSMENALAMRQQLDEMMRKALHMGQAPSRADTSDILQFLHSFEDRVLDQLVALTRRVDALEGAPEGKPRPAARAK